ncbi:N-acetylmuramic acid 6-phosphate etherase [Halobacillus sp. B23F22_1]|uniref:N-acetylmuramic acid 6-phosphate etherase n=1 Tax=Halobacillus sp. B23F22_1 TaxID=3459514 RepID=UPI00373EC8C4
MSTEELLHVMNSEDHKIAHVVHRALPQIQNVIDRATAILEQRGRIFYFGAGTSGRLGVLDASECPPTFGVDPSLVNGIIAGGDKALRYPIKNAEDSESDRAKDVEARISENDMLIGIASSGKTPYVLGAVKKAEQLGILTAGVSCRENAALSELVDFPIDLNVGKEIIKGSKKIKSWYGTKDEVKYNFYNLMIKLEIVYNNLIINVQASNYKLKERTFSIIQEVTGVEEKTARRYAEETEGDVKVAFLMILLPSDKTHAQHMLHKHNGHFPNVMEWIKEDKR